MQVFSNGLSRRTTYRTHPKMAIPVAAPMSPVPPEDLKSERSNCQSPTASSVIAPNHHHPYSSSYLGNTQLKPQPKIYESLKSQFR